MSTRQELTPPSLRRRDDVFVVTAPTARDNPLLHFQPPLFQFMQQREFGFTVRLAFGLILNPTQNVGQVLRQCVDFIPVARVVRPRNPWLDSSLSHADAAITVPLPFPVKLAVIRAATLPRPPAMPPFTRFPDGS